MFNQITWMITRCSKVFCICVASATLAASSASSSPANATKLRGHLREAKLVLPHGGSRSQSILEADLKSELAGIISFASDDPNYPDDVDLTPSAVEKMEKAVTDLVTNSDRATPMGSSVKQIEKLIDNTMLPKVERAHEANQKELDRLASDSEQCKATIEADEKIADVQKLAYLKASPLHKQCRAKEAALATDAMGCGKSISSAKIIRDLRCSQKNEYEKMWGSQAKNAQIVEKGAGETPQIYMKRLHDTFCSADGSSFYETFVKLDNECKEATEKYARLEDGCKQRQADYQAKIKECDNMQNQMDGAACNRAVLVKDACESYAECFNSRRLSFKASEAAVKEAEKDRKAEWRALKRMVCLIDSFRDGKVRQAEVQSCKAKVHETSHLDVFYPSLGEARACVVPNRYPATAAYKQAEFAPLPALAKGKVDANECYGVLEISTKPKAGSPRSCKCTRVTLNGPFSAGALVKCTNCNDVYRATEKDSCPEGTKIFSPRSRQDWHTFLASAGPLRDPHWIVDVTRAQDGCGGCANGAMNSKDQSQSSWMTRDGSPWWLRSTPWNAPSQNYAANCYLDLAESISSEDSVTFRDGGCNVHSRSYYCQQQMISMKPKAGSPEGCQCSRVELTGRYSPGALLKCVGCLRVSRSTDKDSCPEGTKLFSPRSREDWKTVIDSAGPLRSPNWIVDVTRPNDGCAGCRPHEQQAAMNFETPGQASWRTQDGSPWWLRSTKYVEPNGDYQANCFMDLSQNPNNADNIVFNDHDCQYSSNAYYCQPRQVAR